MEDILMWLQQQPPEDEICKHPDRPYKKNGQEFVEEGGFYIPGDIVKTLLDHFESWETKNFKWQYYKAGYNSDGIAASLELVVSYYHHNQLIVRTVGGGCNFVIQSLFPNPNFISTADTLCIMHAAKKLGRRLGRYLNAKEDVVPVELEVSQTGSGVDLLGGMDHFNPKNYAAGG